jgi:acetyl/propionyl-CoA carboxylase alpha subunit
MLAHRKNTPETLYSPIAVETMRTLIICRGPIAFKTLEVYRSCNWTLPHVVVSGKEWIAYQQCAAPWIANLPHNHVHLIEEYTNADDILQIAKAHHLDAIYPGYGFLAESAEFCERVQQAGFRFIGPTPETLRAVGGKESATALAKQIGIPTIPGDDGLINFARTHNQEEIGEETVRRTLELARRHPGYAIRLKNPVGGGGKGQQVISAEALQALDARDRIIDALSKIWAETGVFSNSGDARKGILIELNIHRPLHWEVQIFGDGDSVVHFAARDCSFQNHGYQKFIETSLHLGPIDAEIQKLDRSTDDKRIANLQQRRATLECIGAYALKLGKAIRLRGAATVEFLIDEQRKPYFLEVNPRIQVEHGVTEAIARVRGMPVSLIELQQRVAAGEKLYFKQSDITFVGDAIEVRINAWNEDLKPVLGGVVDSLRLELPPELKDNVRIEAGGLLQRRKPWVIPNYDANFILIIVSSHTRHKTLKLMINILETVLQVDGNDIMHTNLQPVIGLLTLMQALSPETEFRTDTSFIWMALVAVVAAHKPDVTSLVPTFPRKLDSYDGTRFSRILDETISAGFAEPSRLLTFYIHRLTQQTRRPLATLEILFQLAEYLGVTLYKEERYQKDAFQKSINALWVVLKQSTKRFISFCRIPLHSSGMSKEYKILFDQIGEIQPQKGPEEASELLRNLLGLIRCNIPAINALIEALERTQLHVLLSVNEDLSLTCPEYLKGANTIDSIHQRLSSIIRPTILHNEVVTSPMEAIIYLKPEPGAKSFIKVGEDISVGQTLALLEAMKMFSELQCPVDGVLVDILVHEGQGVKKGTPLFKIDRQDTEVRMGDDFITQIKQEKLYNRFGLLSQRLCG